MVSEVKKEEGVQVSPLEDGDVGRPDFPACPECSENNGVSKTPVGGGFHCRWCKINFG